MEKRNFEITAVWDEKAQVWYAQSDIDGLHIEADTLPEFQECVREYAAELIVTNHYQDVDLSKEELPSLIPAIFLKTNDGSREAC